MDCCCGGCSEWPVDRGLSAGSLQPMQQYCCQCVPKQLCVTYSGTDGESSEIVELKRPCQPDDSKSVYRGDLVLSNQLVPVEIAWVVDDKQCYLALTSTFFGETGDNRIAITDANRPTICPTCQHCPEQKVTPDTIDFTVSTGTIAVRPASNTSLDPLDRCCDCVDPCTEPETSNEQGCSPICGGCGCICTTACLTLIRNNGADVTTEIGAICNHHYDASGMVVTLVPGPTGCCELELTDAAGIRWDAQPANVPIGDSLNPCPRPTATWRFIDLDADPKQNQVIAIFNCAGCGGCDEVIVTDCGCTDSVPRTLVASVDGGAGCCGQFTVTLVYDSVEGSWIGSHPTAMCGHEIRLRLTCTSPDWRLTFSGGPCVETTVSHDSADCEPINVSFTVAASGVGCCGGVSGGTLQITVTE